MKGTKDEIKQRVSTLVSEGTKLVKKIAKAKEGDRIKLGSEYQLWFTQAKSIVKYLASDRIYEFESYYYRDSKRKEINDLTYTIQDYVNAIRIPTNWKEEPDFNVHNVAAMKIAQQVQIMESLIFRIDSVLANVEMLLLSDIQDLELQTARNLLKVSHRAAGALAGVVLENHLQKVFTTHSINTNKRNLTISFLNDELKKNDIIDNVAWRKIQFLGDIRNLCSHKSSREPKTGEVEDLINGVNEIIKNIV